MKLAQICGTIAADEKRHETAYTKILEKLFEIDPDGTVMAFADMMRKKISMPAQEFVCKLPPRIRRLEERAMGRLKEAETMMPFSWIFDREGKL